MNPFELFQNYRLPKENVVKFANDWYLIHQAFYTFLGVFTVRFADKNIPEHLQIFRDELGLDPRGQTKEYGAISHADLWLMDLEIKLSHLSFLNNPSLVPFQRLCYEAAGNYEKGLALLAAVEAWAFDALTSLGKILKNSEFKKILSVDLHCDPNNGLEINHEAETEKFKDSVYYASAENAIETFCRGLTRYFDIDKKYSGS